jgi:hypothetical protein
MLSYTPHAGVYLDVELMPPEPGADYCEDWPRIDELDIERDRGAAPVVQTRHVYAWIAPRSPGDACTLSIPVGTGRTRLERGTIVAPGVCVQRAQGRWAPYRWKCVSTLTGLTIGEGHTRREAVREYWRIALQWAPADWPAAHVLQAAARRLARAPLGGEVQA